MVERLNHLSITTVLKGHANRQEVSFEDLATLGTLYRGTPFEKIIKSITPSTDHVRATILDTKLFRYFQPPRKTVTVTRDGVDMIINNLGLECGANVRNQYWEDNADHIRWLAQGLMPGIDKDGLKNVDVVFTPTVPSGQIIVVQLNTQFFIGDPSRQVVNRQYDTWRIDSEEPHVGTLRFQYYFDSQGSPIDISYPNEAALYTEALPLEYYSPVDNYRDAYTNGDVWRRYIYAPLPPEDEFPNEVYYDNPETGRRECISLFT